MFGPLFGRYPLCFFTVRTRKRPLNIRTLDGRLRKARLQKFVSRKTSRILKLNPEGGREGGGGERLGTAWVTNCEYPVKKDQNFRCTTNLSKNGLERTNHQQLLLSCLTFKKPLTESTINYFFEFEQICFVTCFYC